MFKRLRLNVLPGLLALAATAYIPIAIVGGHHDATTFVAIGAAAVIDGTYIVGSYGLRREEARGVAMVAAEHAKGNAGPPPELLDALGQLGSMVGIDVEDLIAGGVPGAPPQTRYPAPWEPTSEAAPHVFRGTPSSPDVHREGRLVSGIQRVPPGARPAKEIPGPPPPP